MNELIDLKFLGSAVVTLFVITDPPSVVPVFLGLVGTRPARERSKLALQATLTSLTVIVLFAILGERLLSYLGITLPSLQAAGGLLLLLMALKLLTGESEEAEAVKDVNVAMVPLGTPLLAGPGAIVATILFAREANSVAQWTALAVAVIVVHLLIWSAMRFSGVLARLLGRSGITLVSRIAGLLLAAIGVQLVVNAVYGFVAARS